MVDAEPGSRAIEYVRRSNEQSLNAELRKKARNLIGDVALDDIVLDRLYEKG